MKEVPLTPLTRVHLPHSHPRGGGFVSFLSWQELINALGKAEAIPLSDKEYVRDIKITYSGISFHYADKPEQGEPKAESQIATQETIENLDREEE